MVCCVSRSNFLRSIIRSKSLLEVWHAKCCGNVGVFRCNPKLQRRIYQYYSNTSLNVVNALSGREAALSKRLICQTLDHSNNGSDSDSEEMEEFLEPSSIPEEKESVHDIISPNSEDLTILRLKASSTVEEVFDTLRENECNVQSIHLTHAVLALWDLQMSSVLLSEKPYVNVSSTLISETFIKEVLSSYYIKTFLEKIKEQSEHMSPNELACTLLYMGKMGFPGIDKNEETTSCLLHEVILKLFSLCTNKLQTFTLPALSRFMVSTRFWRHATPSVFDSSCFRASVEEIVLQCMDCCSNAEDFRLITICLAHLRPSIDLNSLQKYKNLATDLITKNDLGMAELRPALRAAAFLNLPHWSHSNIDLMRRLLLLIKGKVKDLKPSDVVLINRLLQSQMEPAELMGEVQEAASELLQNKSHSLPEIDILSCLVRSVKPSKKKHFEDIVLEFIYSSLSSRLLPVTFSVLRNLKTSNVNLCDAFWSRVLDFIKAKPLLQDGYRLLRYCHWYMHFNNNLAGTYHHHEFERCVSKVLLQDISKWENSSWIARACSFILAYSGRSQGPEVILEVSKKLIEIVPELTPEDCFIVSHGLRIASGLKRSIQTRNKNVLWHLSQVARKIDYQSEELLKNAGLSMRELNLLIKGFIERRFLNEKGSVIPEHIAKYYDSAFEVYHLRAGLSSETAPVLSSRTIRDICTSVMGCGWLFPRAVESMSNYVIQQGLHLTGETVERFVQVLFQLNHWPQKGPQLFQAVSTVLERDKEKISGLNLIQVSLGLCFFNALPSDLIQYIFAVDFLEKIDDEIRFCYAKATYPQRVRHSLMELNRAVCLGYPEADVPWFHSNYCEGIISMEPVTCSHTHDSVYSILYELVGWEREMIQEKAYTPYFHRIDFLLILDADGKPLKPRLTTHKDALERRLRRVAVVIRESASYCRKSGEPRPHLRGLSRLHEQQLQLLGYDVVGIPVHYWDSMQMGSREAKITHLKGRIFGRSPSGDTTGAG